MIQAATPVLGESVGPSAGAHRQAFRPDIEGLRGVAVLLVVLFHAGIPGFSGGFVGVDVFFVLSGYLITALLSAEVEADGRLDLANFYARRARRLLPASFLVLTVTLVASAALLAPHELVRLSRASIATAAYFSNFWFLRGTGDYFAAQATSSPLLHTWSLGVEEQFYLVWPVFVWLLLRRSRRSLDVGMLALLFVSLVGCIVATRVNQPWAFYASPLRAWEFTMGGLASSLAVPAMERRAGLLKAFGWTGLLLVIGSGVVTPQGSFPGLFATIPVLGTTLCLIGGRSAGRGAAGLLSFPPLPWLGRLSYSWYLWHWPVLVLAGTVGPLSMSVRLACAVASLGLAWLTYILVENPMRYHPALLRAPGRTLALAAVVTVLGGVAGVTAGLVGQKLAASPPYEAFTEASQERQPLQVLDCMTLLLETRVRECAAGDTASATTVVLFGDSHAAQWFPAIERAGLEHGWRIVALVKVSCPAATVTIAPTPIFRDYLECDTWRRDAIRRIAALRPELVVQVSTKAAIPYLSSVDDQEGRYAVWGKGTSETVAALRADGGPLVIVLRDTPWMGIDVPACLGRATRRGVDPVSQCAVSADDALGPDVLEVERRAIAGIPGVRLVDLSSELCDDDVCAPILKGLVVYRDEHHLTQTFARSLGPALGSAIAEVMQSAQ